MVGAAIIADPESKGYGFARGVFEYVAKKEERDFPVELVELKRTTFQDGEYKLKIGRNVRQQSCYVVHDPNRPAERWVSDLLFTLKAVASASPAAINSVFPYFRFARQERKDESRVGVNAKAVCDLLSMYNSNAISMDLHAPQIQEYVRSNLAFDNLSSAPVLADHLVRQHRGILEKLVLVSPDLGGGKRLETVQRALAKRNVHAGIALGYKTRPRGTANAVSQVVIIGEVEGMDCLVTDDIIDTGGTAIKTNAALRKKGARSVFMYGTFGLFNKGFEGFEGFDGVMVSDCVDTSRLNGVEVVSLVDLFGEAVYRSHIGESLSGLFE
jgi:ribose-phosphate pyrophosphokinase